MKITFNQIPALKSAAAIAKNFTSGGNVLPIVNINISMPKVKPPKEQFER